MAAKRITITMAEEAASEMTQPPTKSKNMKQILNVLGFIGICVLITAYILFVC